MASFSHPHSVGRTFPGTVRTLEENVWQSMEALGRLGGLHFVSAKCGVGWSILLTLLSPEVHTYAHRHPSLSAPLRHTSSARSVSQFTSGSLFLLSRSSLVFFFFFHPVPIDLLSNWRCTELRTGIETRKRLACMSVCARASDGVVRRREMERPFHTALCSQLSSLLRTATNAVNHVRLNE